MILHRKIVFSIYPTPGTDCDTNFFFFRHHHYLAARTKLQRSKILKEWEEHITFVKRERTGYWSRIDEAVVDPMENLSIIIDGQDQSATAMPAMSEIVHCTEKGIQQRYHRILKLSLSTFHCMP